MSLGRRVHVAREKLQVAREKGHVTREKGHVAREKGACCYRTDATVRRVTKPGITCHCAIITCGEVTTFTPW